ncbi:B12-binding domain-containing radical SAM protein [Streptomyces incarnatus]|uniref:B12-binding domain-containing radical SAM protein n=1 Tax=Streptomyces sp. WP-1 TaxID=3041497 RepID=UPI0011A6B79A|nr:MULTISPECIES: radical SAM protein [Streptomyces]WKE68277.1 radical SAM protein [Streptomyces sp. WP-1]
MSKILVVWPPHVPGYFNAGHHTPLFEVAEYLRRRPGVERVDALDGGALNVNWKDLGATLYQGRYDVIAMMNDYDAVDGFERFLSYARELSPGAKVITFGRLSAQNPGHFLRYDLDAVVRSGDVECGVGDYVEAVLAGEPERPLPGVQVRTADGWTAPTAPGRTLEPDEWALPDVREIPYEAYERLYARDDRKFCGIPFRRELVVPIARGCPVGCSYCDVHEIFGLRERRLGVDAVLEYIAAAREAEPSFEYVSFYAPTFTLNRPWTRELCRRLLEQPDRLPWKCTTTVPHLDEKMVQLMGAAGCVRISVGLETLDEDGHGSLPRSKRVHQDRFESLARWCADAGIELNAFVMVGLPGTSPEGTAATVAFARSLDVRVRPTLYTPLHDLRPTMTTAEVSRYNRHTLTTPTPPELAEQHYSHIFGPESRLTRVQERIPRAAAPVPAPAST